jgi:hypothetical protein
MDNSFYFLSSFLQNTILNSLRSSKTLSWSYLSSSPNFHIHHPYAYFLNQWTLSFPKLLLTEYRLCCPTILERETCPERWSTYEWSHFKRKFKKRKKRVRVWWIRTYQTILSMVKIWLNQCWVITCLKHKIKYKCNMSPLNSAMF